MAVHNNGNLYVVDFGNDHIQKFSPRADLDSGGPGADFLGK
ncbi:MAG: hypothetical protein HUJ26_17960 [Planctomycetaceae bacterium]|nr:hypothetical protein [Planctomycetaceae bacterium]